MKQIGTLMAALALIATVVTACGGSSSTAGTTPTGGQSSSQTGPSTVAGPTITIANMAFGTPLTVAPGTEITVTNNDSVEHSVTSQTAGAFDVEIDGGAHKTFTAPNKPGEYPFHCKYHPSMTGTLIVK